MGVDVPILLYSYLIVVKIKTVLIEKPSKQGITLVDRHTSLTEEDKGS